MLIKSRDPSAGSRSVARRRRRDRPTASPSLGPNDPNDPNDPIDPNDPNDPIDANDPNDPIDPIDPIDAIDAIEPIDRSEIREGALHPCDRS